MFAQGQPSRPRKSPTCNEKEGEQVIDMLPSISIPVETYAFHYWANNWIALPHERPDMGFEYLTYVPARLEGSLAASSLRLAVSATMKGAECYYSKCIVQTRRELKGLSAIHMDDLIIATMLMTNYENIMYQDLGCSPDQADEVGSRFWKDICHYIGTAGLIQLQQQSSQPQDLALYRAVRRPIVRAAMLRGMPVQQWLSEGSVYGEEGLPLRLDQLMIRVTKLRSRFINLMRQSTRELKMQMGTLNDLAEEAEDVDFALLSWKQGISTEWEFSKHPVENCRIAAHHDITFGNIIPSYATLSHAAVWNRYRAVRLIVTSIRMKLLNTSQQDQMLEVPLNFEMNSCQETINSLIMDICHSVPFFFSSGHKTVDMGNSRTRTNFHRSFNPKMQPKTAIFLTWPLIVAVSTEAAPILEKQWLRRKLEMIGKDTGNAVLVKITTGDEFKF
ncbi:hypothetical protein BX600DRAFT_438635 [Xylariales sp. PMI_506]|nr:hypothetical protein BX600DRAFT_438635 [Xylariales sp. PMI_506]